MDSNFANISRLVLLAVYQIAAGLVAPVAFAESGEINCQQDSLGSSPIQAAASADTGQARTDIDVVVKSWVRNGHIEGPGCRVELSETVCSRFAPMRTEFTTHTQSQQGFGTRFLGATESTPGCVDLRIALGRDHRFDPLFQKHVCQGTSAALVVEVTFTRRKGTALNLEP